VAAIAVATVSAVLIDRSIENTSQKPLAGVPRSLRRLACGVPYYGFPPLSEFRTISMGDEAGWFRGICPMHRR
jgi:hypothetical protein